MKKFLTIAAGAGALALAISGTSVATPGSGFVPSPVVNGHFGKVNLEPNGNKTDKWGLVMRTLDETDMGVDKLDIAAGGYSGWHTHPGPVFVTVTSGSITWYDGSNPLCTSHTYYAGQSFIEEPYRIHDVRNASNVATAQYIAMVVKPDGFIGPAFRLDRPKPNNCAS